MRTPDPRDPRNHRKRRPGHARAARKDNPLRRPADRLRYLVNVLLIVVLIIGLPLAGWAAGTLTYDHYQGVAHSQNLGKHQVTAHLTANASHLVPGAVPGGAVGTAPVTWTDGNGTHTSRTVVTEGQHKGTSIRIWVDRTDRITLPPENSSVGLITGVTAGIVAASAAAVFVSGARAGFHRSLDRRLDAQWDKEWAEVEPKWSHRSDR
ncbi:Rv1733c family protein [Streptomyces scopuliridis]